METAPSPPSAPEVFPFQRDGRTLILRRSLARSGLRGEGAFVDIAEGGEMEDAAWGAARGAAAAVGGCISRVLGGYAH